MNAKAKKMSVLIFLCTFMVILLTACGINPTTQISPVVTNTPITTNSPNSGSTPVITTPPTTVAPITPPVNPTNTTTTGNAEVSQNFKINLGQSFEIADQKLKITFNKVLEDSRCPVDVACAWSGQLIGQFTITKNNQPLGELNLKVFGNTNGVAQNLDAYSFKITDVRPLRYNRPTIQPQTSTYTLMMIIDKPVEPKS